MDLRVAVATYFIQQLNGNGYATYTLTCPNNTKSSCGTPSYYGHHTTNWVEQFEVEENFMGFNVCFPPTLEIGYDGDLAPLPCT